MILWVTDLGSAGQSCSSRLGSVMHLWSAAAQPGGSASRVSWLSAGVMVVSWVMYASSPSRPEWDYSSHRGSIRDPRGWKEHTPVHKGFSTLGLCHIYYCLIGQNKSHDQVQIQGVGDRLHLLMGGAATSHWEGMNPGKGKNWQPFLQLTTSTIYKSSNWNGICIRLCSIELLSIIPPLFLE